MTSQTAGVSFKPRADAYDGPGADVNNNVSGRGLVRVSAGEAAPRTSAHLLQPRSTLYDRLQAASSHLLRTSDVFVTTYFLLYTAAGRRSSGVALRL